METELKTIEYYNKNAADYIMRTSAAEMHKVYSKFLKYLPKSASILDLGCGSGRDSKYFLSKGFSVTAVDGSEEIAKLASKETGIEVQCIRFDQLNYKNCFDAVWANASLLHVEKSKMHGILEKISKALKNNGILYSSFKYGTTEREEDGKHYSDYTEKDIEDIIKNTEFKCMEYWISNDTLKRDNSWLNIILKSKP